MEDVIEEDRANFYIKIFVAFFFTELFGAITVRRVNFRRNNQPIKTKEVEF